MHWTRRYYAITYWMELQTRAPSLDLNLAPRLLRGPGGQRLEFCFDEPAMSSDSGLLLVASDPWAQKVCEQLASCIRRGRRKSTQGDLALSQRIYQILAGYVDANDSNHLRNDAILQACVGRVPGPDATLASQPTVSRLENEVSRTDLLRMAYKLVDLFMDSYEGKPPPMLVLDLDPTACLTYGQQELSFFNGHIGDHCLMPFHLYEGQSGRLITTLLRTGKTPSAAEILGLLKRVVRHIRQRWPRVRLCLRADSHHTKPEVLKWLEDQQMDYILGYAPNARLEREFSSTIQEARRRYEQHKQLGAPNKEVRTYASGWHVGGSWEGQARRVIARVICGPMGVDARFIVTSFQGAKAKGLYEGVYCQRGSAELFIKAHKLDLGGDRLSCHKASANQMRLMLHSAAYMIMDGFRRKRLEGSALAKASFGRIRLELMKVAVRIERLQNRVRLHLSWKMPALESFCHVLEALGARMLGVVAT